MRRLLKCVRKFLVAVGVLKAQRKQRRRRPEGIAAAPYTRGGGGSGSESTLVALEALIEIGEEILARLPDAPEDDE